MASMEDGDDESEGRLSAIDEFELTRFVFDRRLEELKLEEWLLKGSKKLLKVTEDYLKYLTYTRAEDIGEVVQSLDEERFLVKGNMPTQKNVKVNDGVYRYVTRCYSNVDKSKLIAGTRVTIERKSLIITRILPPKSNPWIYYMLHHDPGDVSYSDIGGLSDQLQELRDCIERPLTNPENFKRVGVKPPKGVLLYGPPGTGKTLLARAIAKNVDSTFMAVASSAIVGISFVRDMFKYARDHQPCIIFMDDIDAIGKRRQVKTRGYELHELLSQLDGFDPLDQVKVIMATNKPQVLDPALLRPCRIKKIEIPLPNESSRLKIFKVHASGINKQGEIDYENIAKLSEGFNGADMRNICTEAGMFAIRADRDYTVPKDFIKAVRKLREAKEAESS